MSQPNICVLLIVANFHNFCANLYSLSRRTLFTLINIIQNSDKETLFWLWQKTNINSKWNIFSMIKRLKKSKIFKVKEKLPIMDPSRGLRITSTGVSTIIMRPKEIESISFSGAWISFFYQLNQEILRHVYFQTRQVKSRKFQLVAIYC